MSREDDVFSIDHIMSGFTVAEAAAEDAIELILAEGGKLLYQKYIDNKSFSFSAEAISDLLAAELKLCFVRHDAGEPTDKATASPASSSTAPCATSSSPTPSVPISAENAAASSSSPTATEVQDSGANAAASSVRVSDSCQEVSCFNWDLEPEPMRCRIDTWARACVPVRRTVRAKSQSVADQAKKQQATKTKKPPVLTSPRAPSQRPEKSPAPTPANGRQAEDSTQAQTKLGRDGMIPLIENVEHDEEEAAMREMKEREAKRKREEDNRVQKKASEEAEEAAKLALVKDQMKNKPFTYDSAGNIIWVQAMQADRLPSTNAIPNFVLRREIPTAEHGHDRKSSVELAKVKAKPKRPAKPKAHAGPEFVDTFKKFSSQQPPMMETMKMSPGVKLRERGNIKSGEDINKSANGALMTRRDYESLKSSGGTGYPPAEKEQSKEAEPAAASASAPPPEPQAAAAAAAESENPADPSPWPQSKEPSSRAQGGGVKAKVAPVTPGGLVPHAPSMPRPEQPVPPPSLRRVQMKAAAVGYGVSTRERVPTGTGSRYPGCAAPPILGATMGHGLVPQGSKYEEYYFPGTTSLGAVIDDENIIAVPESPRSSAVMSPRHAQDGQIISKNPELLRRLINR